MLEKAMKKIETYVDDVFIIGQPENETVEYFESTLDEMSYCDWVDSLHNESIDNEVDAMYWAEV